MRRETRRLSYLKIDEQPGEADIVCDDIIKLKLDYYDHRDKVWREEWQTTSLDGQPDRLPSKIRITLTVRDERGKEVPVPDRGARGDVGAAEQPAARTWRSPAWGSRRR